MTTQHEALRLADRLESDLIRSQTMLDAAAELRRLSAEHEEDQKVIAVWRGRTQRAEAQRDALLEALKDIGKYTGEGSMYTTPWQDIVRSIGEKARAAIKAVEGEKE